MKLLLEGAPPQVIFAAVERLEEVAGYMCYYAVAKDLKEPRGRYEWRRALIDYESFHKTQDAAFFWETQPKEFTFGAAGAPEEAEIWVQKQFGKFEVLERLIEDYGLGAEFNDLCFEQLPWERGWGVFTILPAEVEARNDLALEFLKERLEKKCGTIDAKA